MVYGYIRVSTRGQARDGNSMEAQEQQLRAAGAEVLYSDSTTGSKVDRPNFDKLLKELKPGDTFICTKLDRFARSLAHGSELVTELINKGIRVHILNLGIMDNTPASKLIRHIFFSFAEFERDMIIERTQEGKAIARTKQGFKEGRPTKFTDFQIQEAVRMKEQLNYTYKEIEERTRISKSTLIRAVKKYRDQVAMGEIAEIDQLKGQIKL